MGSPLHTLLIQTGTPQRTVGVSIMSLDLYTQNIPLTQKARFWSNYVAALKGSQDLAPVHSGDPPQRLPRPEARVRQARVTDVRQASSCRNPAPDPRPARCP